MVSIGQRWIEQWGTYPLSVMHFRMEATLFFLSSWLIGYMGKRPLSCNSTLKRFAMFCKNIFFLGMMPRAYQRISPRINGERVIQGWAQSRIV